jgi:hypothetical protein
MDPKFALLQEAETEITEIKFFKTAARGST